MKVVLIRPNSRLRATTLPLGMGYVGQAAREAGHEVSLIDARLRRLSPEAAAKEAAELRPDVMGISAIHFEKRGAVDLARALRKTAGDAPILLGGPLVSTSGEDLARDGTVDGAIIGEGETALLSYLEALGAGDLESVPSLIFKRGGDIRKNERADFIADVDRLVPAWDLIDPTRYWSLFGRNTQNLLRRSQRSATIFTSRGCPFGCIYCHNVFGKGFRARSPEAVMEEIERLVKDFGVRELEIVDDAFNVKLDRAKEIARSIIRSGLGLHISFSNGLRADRMDEELIDLLKRAGTYRINYAVETASPRLQKSIHKNLDLDKTQRIIEYTAGKGIFILGYFMLGFPTETESEMLMTVDYALASKCHAAGIFYVNPFPGTPLAELSPAPRGGDAIEDMDYTSLMVNLSEVSDDRLRAISKDAYRRFHFSPDRMWRTFKVVPKNLRTAWSVAIVAALSVRDVGNF